jgi:D-glycero-D-manno-heptose 1,7-bisphosphate phosphatase
MKVLFLDRDGIINFDSKHYIKSPEEWKPIPGSIEAIAQLSKAGYKIGVATNQSGIARGYYSEEVLSNIHQKMFDLVKEAGGQIQEVVYCPHMPDAGCECRKPRPGMLKELAKRFNCSPKGVYFVGDRVSDIRTANAVSARPILIPSQMSEEEAALFPEVPRFKTLLEFASHLITNAER